MVKKVGQATHLKRLIWGTGDMLCAIQVFLEKINELKERDAYILFMYYSKSFDSVDHHEIVQTLKQMGFLLHLIAHIWSLYTDQSEEKKDGTATTQNHSQ